MNYSTVKISNDDLCNMLFERLKTWNLSIKESDLFEQMYENAVYDGVFDGAEFNCMRIVDNDVNYFCKIVDERNHAFKKIKKLWQKGIREIDGNALELGYFTYIEAASDDLTMFLIK